MYRTRVEEKLQVAASAQGQAQAAEESNKIGNGGGNTGNGDGKYGRLGTPAFINLPEPRPLSSAEIDDITGEINKENDLQV